MKRANSFSKHVIALDASTWRIEEGKGAGRVYCYVLAGEKSSIVIDTGLGILDIRRIAESLTSLPISVVNTHGHLDHVSHNYQFDCVYRQIADEDVFRAHTSEAVRSEYIKGLLAEKHLPGWLIRLPLIRKVVRRLCTIPPLENRTAIADGDTFDLGGRKLQVIETPGHTKGSICLLDVERRQLYTGDTVCAEGVLLQFDHSADVATYLRSIRRLMEMRLDLRTVWMAFGGVPWSSRITPTTLRPRMPPALFTSSMAASKPQRPAVPSSATPLPD